MGNQPTLTSLLGPSPDNQQKTVLLTGFPFPIPFLGYVSGRVYPLWSGGEGAAAVAQATSIIWCPFQVPVDIAPTKIGVFVTTGGAGSTVKMGVWNHNLVTKRPSGLMIPGTGSNTGQSTASSTTAANNNATATLRAGVPYWFGAIFTATLPTVAAIPQSQYNLSWALGESVAGSAAITALTTAFTFANDITAFDPSTVGFTDTGGTGNPIPYMTAP